MVRKFIKGNNYAKICKSCFPCNTFGNFLRICYLFFIFIIFLFIFSVFAFVFFFSLSFFPLHFASCEISNYYSRKHFVSINNLRTMGFPIFLICHSSHFFFFFFIIFTWSCAKNPIELKYIFIQMQASAKNIIPSG